MFEKMVQIGVQTVPKKMALSGHNFAPIAIHECRVLPLDSPSQELSIHVFTYGMTKMKPIFGTINRYFRKVDKCPTGDSPGRNLVEIDTSKCKRTCQTK